MNPRFNHRIGGCLPQIHVNLHSRRSTKVEATLDVAVATWPPGICECGDLGGVGFNQS